MSRPVQGQNYVSMRRKIVRREIVENGQISVGHGFGMASVKHHVHEEVSTPINFPVE
jgi:hypothetical protein